MLVVSIIMTCQNEVCRITAARTQRPLSMPLMLVALSRVSQHTMPGVRCSLGYETNGMIMDENTDLEWFKGVQDKLADAFLKEGVYTFRVSGVGLPNGARCT